MCSGWRKISKFFRNLLMMRRLTRRGDWMSWARTSTGFRIKADLLTGQTGDATRSLAEARERYDQAAKLIDNFALQFKNFDTIAAKAGENLDAKEKALEKDSESFLLDQMPIGTILLWPAG
jgi:hypothetical protein